MRSRRGALLHRRITWQAASLLLAYPDAGFAEKLDRVEQAIAELPPDLRAPLTTAIAELRATDSVAERYVDTFDLHRSRTLLLTYWTHGDTRNRGAAMLAFASAFRVAGVQPPTDELPDHLGVVLEFAATVDPVAGAELLQRHLPVLAALHEALAAMPSPYAAVVEAVMRTLPDHRSVVPLGPPPTESVGLEPYSAFVSSDQLAGSIRARGGAR